MENGLLNLNVLFFGATADACGTRGTPVAVPAGSTAGEAVDALVVLFPALSRHKLLFAVNQEYVDRGEKLSDGDELAVFTAVSGG